MITSIHTLIYSDDPNATRAFLRDVLGWKYVAEDFDNNWLIFKSGPSEMGVHPTHSEWEGRTYDYPRHHSLALMCDDIETTVADLRERGAQFRGGIEQREYGRIIMITVPGADDIQLGPMTGTSTPHGRQPFPACVEWPIRSRHRQPMASGSLRRGMALVRGASARAFHSSS